MYKCSYRQSNCIMFEVEYWCRKWKQQFMLEWAKGHSEARDASRSTWTVVDWMNHVADRADAKYRSSPEMKMRRNA